MRRRLVGWSVGNDFIKMRCDCALSFSRVLKASRNPCPTLDLTNDVSLNARRRIIDRSVLLKSSHESSTLVKIILSFVPVDRGAGGFCVLTLENDITYDEESVAPGCIVPLLSAYVEIARKSPFTRIEPFSSPAHQLFRTPRRSGADAAAPSGPRIQFPSDLRSFSIFRRLRDARPLSM